MSDLIPCLRCGEDRFEEFSRGSSRPDGLQPYCKKCNRNHRIKKVFGLSDEEYDSMLQRQGGVCAICQRPPARNHLAVDHDHDTGAIRGLLCPPCNRSVEWMIHHGEAASLYLEGIHV